MDQLIHAPLSHTHYWYDEVGMLKVPANVEAHRLKVKPGMKIIIIITADGPQRARSPTNSSCQGQPSNSRLRTTSETARLSTTPLYSTPATRWRQVAGKRTEISMMRNDVL